MMSNKEAIKLLTAHGFKEVNQVGSHKKFKKGNQMFTIVYHKSLKETLCKKQEKSLKTLLKLL